MKILKWLFLIVLVFLLQTQFYLLKDFFNITVALVYFFGLKSLRNVSAREYSSSRIEVESIIFGIAVGLAEDILSGSIIGPGLLSKGIIGLITPVIFTSMVFKWTPLWGVIIIAIFTILDGVIVMGSRVLFTGIHLTGVNVLQMLLIQPIMNIPFGIFLKP